MNRALRRMERRKAISPIIATVILIAITLIAAIAIAGFVFGLFGSFSASAQVSASSSIASTQATAAGQANFACQTTAPTGSYILLTNSGTGAANALSVSVTAGGVTKTVPIGATACVMSAAGGTTPDEYVTLTGLGFTGTQGASGVPYTGSVTLSNGAAVSFSGTFH
jgi:flagellin-like protein